MYNFMYNAIKLMAHHHGATCNLYIFQRVSAVVYNVRSLSLL